MTDRTADPGGLREARIERVTKLLIAFGKDTPLATATMLVDALTPEATAPDRTVDPGGLHIHLPADFTVGETKEVLRALTPEATAPTCQCGHRDINHSDVSLDALGACYQCGCPEFTPEATAPEHSADHLCLCAVPSCPKYHTSTDEAPE